MCSPLFLACRDINDENVATGVVELLLNHGADVNFQHANRSIFSMVCEKAWLEVIKILFSYNVKVNDLTLWLSFSSLIKRKNEIDYKKFVAVSRYILNTSGTICQDVSSMLLYVACEHLDKDFVEYLIGMGADIDYSDNSYERPISNVSFYKNREFFEYLIDKGATTETWWQYENNPVMEAIRRGNKKDVEYLLDNGYDLNERRGLSKTPLEEAWGNDDMFLFLLEHGADPFFDAGGGGEHMMRLAADDHDIDKIKLMCKYI